MTVSRAPFVFGVLCAVLVRAGGAAELDLAVADSLTLAARDVIDERIGEMKPGVESRQGLADGIGRLLLWELGYHDGPCLAWAGDKNTVEWILLTDGISDTLCSRLHPLLKRYTQVYPEEVLTEGRQAFELANIKLNPPATRMLGFHVTRMGRLTYTRADSLLHKEGVTDVEGLQDGYLRMLWDWLQQYDQSHSDVVVSHMARITQEDWVIARLKPSCPEGRAYSIAGQYMSFSPDRDVYSHRFILASSECGDQVTIQIPLPDFRAYMEEVGRMSMERQEQLLKEKTKYR